MGKAMEPFRDSLSASWLSGSRTYVPAEPPLICLEYDIQEIKISYSEHTVIHIERESIQTHSIYVIIFFLFSFLDIDSIPEVKGTDIIETKTQNVNILNPIGYPCQNATTPGFQSFTIHTIV